MANPDINAPTVPGLPGNGDAKSIFTSRTFWFNILSAILLTAGPALGLAIPQPFGGLVTAGINIILRYITTQPVKVA